MSKLLICPKGNINSVYNEDIFVAIGDSNISVNYWSPCCVIIAKLSAGNQKGVKFSLGINLACGFKVVLDSKINKIV